MIEDYDKIPVENNTWGFTFYPSLHDPILVEIWDDGDVCFDFGEVQIELFI